MVYLDRFEGDDRAGELSGDKYGVFRLRLLICGVSTSGSSMVLVKFTVFRGVVLRLVLLQRLIADRVSSCSWRPELPIDLTTRDPFFEFLGVKNRVKRLGVIGGGFFGFRPAIVEVGCGGDDEGISDTGPLRPSNASEGENMVLEYYIYARVR